MTDSRKREDWLLDYAMELEKRLARALEMLADAVVVAEGA